MEALFVVDREKYMSNVILPFYQKNTKKASRIQAVNDAEAD